MANRSSAYYRMQRRNHIARKQRIIKEQNNYWHVDHASMLSKGKIHCSCPLCRHKSYDSPKIQDRRNSAAMDSKIQDYESSAA